jgi:hypothetical protein
MSALSACDAPASICGRLWACPVRGVLAGQEGSQGYTGLYRFWWEVVLRYYLFYFCET